MTLQFMARCPNCNEIMNASRIVIKSRPGLPKEIAKNHYCSHKCADKHQLAYLRKHGQENDAAKQKATSKQVTI